MGLGDYASVLAGQGGPLRGGFAALDRLRALAFAAAMIDASVCRCRPWHGRCREQVAQAGVEAHQELAHDRDQDDQPWLAALAQAFAERLDGGVEAHGATGWVEQNGLDRSASRGEPATSLAPPTLVHPWRQAGERGDLLGAEPAKLGQFAQQRARRGDGDAGLRAQLRLFGLKLGDRVLMGAKLGLDRGKLCLKAGGEALDRGRALRRSRRSPCGSVPHADRPAVGACAPAARRSAHPRCVRA